MEAPTPSLRIDEVHAGGRLEPQLAEATHAEGTQQGLRHHFSFRFLVLPTYFFAPPAVLPSLCMRASHTAHPGSWWSSSPSHEALARMFANTSTTASQAAARRLAEGLSPPPLQCWSKERVSVRTASVRTGACAGVAEEGEGRLDERRACETV